jgi:hypothetical protein
MLSKVLANTKEKLGYVFMGHANRLAYAQLDMQVCSAGSPSTSSVNILIV